MKIEKFPLGILGANCYLLINEETKDTVVVDPGGHSKKFTAYIEEEKLNLVAILLTHGHFDHIGAVDYLYEHYHCPIYLHQDDLENLPVFSHLLPKPGEYLSYHLLFLLFQDKQNSP